MKDTLQILVVDDSDDDRDYIKELLEQDDAQTWALTGTSDSKEGLRLVEKHHFDCILLDYSLPGYNGIQVLERLRATNLEVPVIILTGFGNERVAVAAMKAGAQDYIPKSEIAWPRLGEVIFEAIDTKRKQLELLQRANYDHLTGLVGRALFVDRLRLAASRSDRQGTAFTLVFVDLDGFKQVNDTLGHQAGDMLLKDVAARLQKSTREGDVVARLGGDEFVIIFEDLPGDGLAATEKLMTRLVDEFAAHSYPFEGQAIEVRASMGAAIYPTLTNNKDELLRAADAAMYTAKRMPGSCFKIAGFE